MCLLQNVWDAFPAGTLTIPCVSFLTLLHNNDDDDDNNSAESPITWWLSRSRLGRHLGWNLASDSGHIGDLCPQAIPHILCNRIPPGHSSGVCQSEYHPLWGVSRIPLWQCQDESHLFQSMLYGSSGPDLLYGNFTSLSGCTRSGTH